MYLNSIKLTHKQLNSLSIGNLIIQVHSSKKSLSKACLYQMEACQTNLEKEKLFPKSHNCLEILQSIKRNAFNNSKDSKNNKNK